MYPDAPSSKAVGDNSIWTTMRRQIVLNLDHWDLFEICILVLVILSIFTINVINPIMKSYSILNDEMPGLGCLNFQIIFAVPEFGQELAGGSDHFFGGQFGFNVNICPFYFFRYP